MANQVILPAQKLLLSDLKASFPNKKIKKVFFQCELRSISGNDATFGVIAYAGKRNPLNKWIVGTKVNCIIDEALPAQRFDIPLAFGNNELVDFNFDSKKKKSKKTSPKNISQDKLMSAINRILKSKDKSKLLDSILYLKPKLSRNPHIYYEVTMDTSRTITNPSPPAPPEG